MKTNLLAQNDDLVIENLKADVGKSVMDLSHSVTFPIDVDGAILPICCIETLPSDSFEISVECLLRQLSPLKVPVMTNLRLNTAFYYCDNRLAWKKWDRFMTGGRSGNEVYDVPRVANYYRKDNEEHYKYDLIDLGNNLEGAKHQNYSTTLHTYFGISLNRVYNSDPSYSDMVDESDELPLAFPFFGYQMICRDFYTNVDRLLQHPKADYHNYSDIDCDWTYSNLFPSDDDEVRLTDGVQLSSGFFSTDDNEHGTKGFLLDKVRYHDVRPDYFTSSKKAPMRGQAPSLSAVTSNLKLPSGSILSVQSENKSSKLFYYYSDNIHAADQLVEFELIGVNNVQNHEKVTPGAPFDPNGTYSNKPFVEINPSGEYTLTNDVSVYGSVSTDFTAADIRLLSQLTVWQELNMLHEPYYNDFLNAHFDGVRVGESPVEKPQYIGGTSQLISINEILQTSQTSDTSPLGNQGATAMSLASNFVGRYYSNNYGFIIGVAYIVPDMLYKPAMPRSFSRRTKEDYYSPEFANLSMQATLNKEIFFSNDNDWNNQPWGYTGAFDELRSIPNRIAGEILNPNYTDLQKWILTRNFSNDNKPAMSHTFLSLKDNVDKTAWAVQTMPAFILQCANYIKAVRPMPKIAIPKAV